MVTLPNCNRQLFDIYCVVVVALVVLRFLTSVVWYGVSFGVFCDVGCVVCCDGSCVVCCDASCDVCCDVSCVVLPVVVCCNASWVVTPVLL